MAMRICKTLAVLALGAVLATTMMGCGITASSHDEGFADLDSLGFRDVDRTMSLSLGPTLLSIAASSTGDDPQTQALLQNLNGVRVKTYDITGSHERVEHRIDTMSRKLQDDGWQPVVMVQGEGERTVMLVKVRGELMLGITVITCDAEEAVIVNVMGELQPDMFSEAMVALDVDVPDVQVAQAP
ncbi:MAG: DUF4252 domain-containing protein [Halieaceae bacterium]